MKNNPVVKIIITTHKQYRMPTDPMYIPLYVGADLGREPDGDHKDFGYAKDNTGDNISCLNASFCELTGLYWAWKNLEADYIGMVHYRRYLGFKKTKDPFDGILTYDQLAPYLGYKKIFVPRKRKYYIETLYSHYAHTHYAEQLDKTREIINEKYPEYLESYDHVIRQHSGYMFNIMIMDHGLLNSYCQWLFPVLFELQGRVKTQGLSYYQRRIYGRVSEILFNVWIDYQLENGVLQKEEVMEIPCIYIEKVNWIKKATAFLEAKFLGVKYKDSDSSYH